MGRNQGAFLFFALAYKPKFGLRLFFISIFVAHFLSFIRMKFWLAFFPTKGQI